MKLLSRASVAAEGLKPPTSDSLRSRHGREPITDIPRNTLFFWVFLILAANSLSGVVMRAVLESGAAVALLWTFGVSAIVWVALGAALALLARSGESRSANSIDAVFCGGACLVALLPMANLSSVAMTVLAGYAIWSSNPETAARRAGAIFLAITANLIWGRLMLGLFSRTLLIIDAFFVNNLVGSEQVGNTISFIGQPGVIVVSPGCSSLQGISLAVVFFVTLSQWLSIKINTRTLLWCGYAIMAAFAINIVRIAALVHYPDYFEEIHTGWGAQLASYATMVAIVGIVLWGARREVFR